MPACCYRMAWGEEPRGGTSRMSHSAESATRAAVETDASDGEPLRPVSVNALQPFGDLSE